MLRVETGSAKNVSEKRRSSRSERLWGEPSSGEKKAPERKLPGESSQEKLGGPFLVPDESLHAAQGGNRAQSRRFALAHRELSVAQPQLRLLRDSWITSHPCVTQDQIRKKLWVRVDFTLILCAISYKQFLEILFWTDLFKQSINRPPMPVSR